MENCLSLIPSELETSRLHRLLLGSVGPRPIALASTVNAAGQPNLSPFSFFNVFSAKPPILIFSPARRVRDNTPKHTLENVTEVPEVVINIVNYDMVQQTSLSSTEYAQGINEFKKAGFTMQASDLVKPFRVAESPVQMECRVNEVVPLGKEGGAGNLVICEVLKIHIRKAVLDEEGFIDQHKIDLVSRLGGNWYGRSASGLFEVPKPLTHTGIGVDNIPLAIRGGGFFNGNELGLLGNVEAIPTAEAVDAYIRTNQELRVVLSASDEGRVIEMSKEFLKNNLPEQAWKTLLAYEAFKQE